MKITIYRLPMKESCGGVEDPSFIMCDKSPEMKKDEERDAEKEEISNEVELFL